MILIRIVITELYEGLSNATLTAYIHDSHTNDSSSARRPAIIICPGGAYLGYTESEAEPIAIRFLAEGYNAFVLRYSIGAGAARFPAPFIDAAKAVMLVRQNAENWSVDVDKISICGFSAGGHVAATFAATWQEEYLAKALNADNELFKPNSLVLGYPILNINHFAEKNLKRNKEMQPLLEMMLGAVTGYPTLQVGSDYQWNSTGKITSHMPPTFLWMTAEDALVDVGEGLDFVKALAENEVSCEFHVFQKGAHGLSLANQESGCKVQDGTKHGNAGKWIELAVNWLRTYSL